VSAQMIEITVAIALLSRAFYVLIMVQQVANSHCTFDIACMSKDVCSQWQRTYAAVSSGQCLSMPIKQSINLHLLFLGHIRGFNRQ